MHIGLVRSAQAKLVVCSVLTMLNFYLLTLMYLMARHKDPNPISSSVRNGARYARKSSIPEQNRIETTVTVTLLSYSCRETTMLTKTIVGTASQGREA